MDKLIFLFSQLVLICFAKAEYFNLGGNGWTATSANKSRV